MEQYLKELILPLLKQPAYLQVIQTEDAMGVLLSVTVHKQDMGVVIGKGGEMIRAVRTIIHCLGSMTEKKIAVKVNEPTGDYTTTYTGTTNVTQP